MHYRRTVQVGYLNQRSKRTWLGVDELNHIPGDDESGASVGGSRASPADPDWV